MTHEDQIRRTLAVLSPQPAVIELRCPHTTKGTITGYYDDWDRLVQDAMRLDGTVPGVYVTVNPCAGALLARSANHVTPYAKAATADDNIVARCWLPIDFDPIRPSGIPASDNEHELALACAQETKRWLSERGWPDPVEADSGNGAYCLYRIALPNDLASRDLLRQCLEVLALRFSDDAVGVDTGMFNAARIVRLFGSLNRKGDAIPDRPHRRSRLLSVPACVEVVPMEALQRLAALRPEEPKPDGRVWGSQPLDVVEYLRRHGCEVSKTKPWNSGTVYEMQCCPFNSDHIKSSSVIQFPTGATCFQCFHNGCQGNDWRALRTLLEPDFHRGETDSSNGANHFEQDSRSSCGPRTSSQVKQLLEVASNETTLFHTSEHEPYATISVNGHQETWPLKSKTFRRWLSRQFYARSNTIPRAQILQDVLGVLEGQALFQGREQNVFTRLAEHNGHIYLDLSNAAWEAVEIGQDDWRIVPAPPVKFRRTRGMLPLPTPVRGGSLQDLQRFLNLGSEQNWILVVAWLVAALCPHGPYPVLDVKGEQGSAKSSLVRILRALVDPNTCPLRADPRTVHDVMIAATNSWILAFDNLSRIEPWLSDAICRLSTGGGLSTRELYTDSEEILFDAQRPVVLNGIEELVTRADLLDRALSVYLPEIPDDKRQTEEALWGEFEKARPSILGALFTVLSGTLKHHSSVKLLRPPRMADFAAWAVAAEKAMQGKDGTFLRAYTSNRETANDLALEASSIVPVIRLLLEKQSSWTGTASDLLSELANHADDQVKRQRSWPNSPQGLSNQLRRLAPNLKVAEIR